MPLFKYKKANLDLFYTLEGSGPPLFFISGYLANHQGMLPLSKEFTDNYTVILLDNRGAGQSTHPEEAHFFIEDMAHDVVALMDHLKIDKAHFIGASMGSGIVLTLSLLFPERMQKSILITPFHKMPTPSLIAAKLAKEALEGSLPFEQTYLSFMAWLYSDAFLSNPANIQAKMEQVAQSPAPTSLQGACGQYHALKAYDVSDKLTSIQTPLLLLAGEQDLLAPLYVVNHLKKHLQNAELYTFNKGAHMIHHETKLEVAEQIKKFL